MNIRQELARAARWRLSSPRFLQLSYAGVAGCGLLASQPVRLARTDIFENHYHIPVPHLPPAFEGFRIVHLADFHYGLYVPLWFISSLVARVNEMPRDAVVLTGDYVDRRWTQRHLNTVWPVLRQLQAPEGVFAVLGNHDHWACTACALGWLDQTGFGVRHQARCVERNGQRLWFAGAGDLWEDHLSLDVILADVPDADCRIVLAHNPDTADSPHESRVDLMLSGHTHGGQIRLPWRGSPKLSVKNRRYDQGFRISDKGAGVFITRGVGWTGFPIRFNCPPEIAVLHLHRP